LLILANYTYAKRGTKAVNSYTTRQERTKISCAFCASASGKKLPVLILVPRKKPLKNFTPPENVIIVYSGSKKSFNQDTIKDSFIQRILSPEVLRQNHKKSVLYLDNATCHTTVGVKSKLENVKMYINVLLKSSLNC
jgi:hypothetical protein